MIKIIKDINSHRKNIILVVLFSVGLVFLYLYFFEDKNDVFLTASIVLLGIFAKYFIDTDNLTEKIMSAMSDVVSWQEKHIENEHKNNDYVNTNSPLNITENGYKILNESGAQKYLENHFDSLFGKFKKIDNPYFIQKKAQNVIYNERENIEKELWQYLYKNGESIGDITYPMSVRLRDMVFERKGIKVEK